MISERFYHTDEITENGMILTEDIKSCADITQASGDYAYPYYMGYLNFNEMPATTKIGKVFLDDSTHISFIEPEQRNHGWGFMTTLEDNGEPVGAIIYTTSQNQIVYEPAFYSGNPTIYRFINEGMMANIAYANSVKLRGRGIVVPEADLDDNGTAYGYPSDGVYTIFETIATTFGVIPGTAMTSNLSAFLNNQVALNFGTTTVNGTTVNLEFYYSDFEADVPIAKKTFEINGTSYVLYFTISSYAFPCYAAYKSGSNTYQLSVVPFIEYSGYEGEGIGEKMYSAAQVGFSTDYLKIDIDYSYGCEINSMTCSSVDGFRSWYFGSFYVDGNEIYGTLDTTHPEECWWYRSGTSNNFPGAGRMGIIRGRHITYGESGLSNIFRLYKMCDVNDIYNHYMLFHKVDKQNYLPAQTVPSNTYTTQYSTSLFNEDDSPGNVRVEEALSDRLLDKLRPWQRPNTDISEDEFNIDDMPDYEPEDDEEDDGGDDIFFNTNVPIGLSAFITSYAMTPAMVSKVGTEVWTKVVHADTSDMIKNFFLFNSSFNPSQDKYDLIAANILDYFISLKYYPFDVKEATSGGTLTSSIYVGTGTEAINLGSSGSVPLEAYRLGQQVAILDGGEVELPKGYTEITGIANKIETFLDHEPHTTVSIYVPFCGTVQVPASVVMGSTLSLTYCVDLNTGGCMAVICKKGKKQFPIATVNGTCGFDIMLTGNNAQTVQANANNAIANFTIDAARTGVGMLTAGIGGLVGAQSASGSIGGIINGAENLAFNSAKFAQNLPQMMATTPLTAGSSSTLSAILTPLTAYVQIRRHVAQTDKFDLVGYTLDKLSSVASANGMGFVQMLNPILDGLSCTQKEAEMIRQLLTQGIWT